MTRGLRVAVAALLAVIASAAPIVAQSSQPAWLSLELGKRAYADKDFGAALVHFDRALMIRRDAFTSAAVRLDQGLDSKAAREAGDSIEAVLSSLAREDFIQRDYARLAAGRRPGDSGLLEDLRRERISDSHRALVEVLLLVIEYRSLGELGDSIERLRECVRLLALYPEAEYWKGRLFFIEGELALAELQYERAYGMREALEVPGEAYSILYAMAELYEVRSEYVAWENVMLRVIEGLDSGVDRYLEEAMLATLTEQGFNRFMTLYRLDDSYSKSAHASLAAFYLERGRAAAPRHAAIAVNMILSRAIAMLKARDGDYVWTDLQNFMARALGRRDVMAYLDETGFAANLFTLADALYVAGARAPALMLWGVIADQGIAPLSARAGARLSDPRSAVRRGQP